VTEGVPSSGPTVERLSLADWEALRSVRLAALADAPYAFASSLELERGYDEPRWRSFLAAATWFVARCGGQIVGVVALLLEAGGSAERHLVSMWVAPQVRGTGTARRLLDAALASAADDGTEIVSLWVADGNARARRFYEQAGFSSSGQRQPLPSAPELGEELLALRLEARPS
jgi:ribosomal protein S18 acetylase RimI-like enzyme